MTMETVHSNRLTSFALHIQPLFRDLDVEHMSYALDLSDYGSVKDNAEQVLARLKSSDSDMMPPEDDGGPWPNEWISLFERWIKEGYPE